MPEVDVIVVGVGAGNATRAAAVAAKEQGARRVVVFHVNYPGGTGLMSGAVFGRLAGAHPTGA